jgi:acetyl esterase
MGTKKSAKTEPKIQPRTHKLRRLLIIGFSSLIFIVIAVYISFQVSPWPGSLVIRYFFDKGGRETSAKLEKYVPSGIASSTDLQYRSGDKDAYLDVYYPGSVKNTEKTLPTVVWIHGGAWISGDKKNIANYLKILASHNYTTVSVGYSIAPGKTYPTPVLQVNDALAYLERHAKELHINPDNLILAGDSAGSQIAAQVGTIITNPTYAREVGMSSPLAASKLRGMVLNCGAYDLALPNYNGEDGKFLKTVLWAYSGDKNFMDNQSIKHASVVDYVNADFPPSFITAGNADPLEQQSREFAAKLTSLGVGVDSLFYPEDHEPKLGHEYQFDLDLKDGKQAFTDILDFLYRTTRQ